METCDDLIDAPSCARIATLEELHQHVQWAVELEHATIPMYLCALYSLDRARNPEAAEVLTSVFVEEMLHLTLAANLLNALGGRPELDSPRLLAPYPRSLPHGDPSVQVSLLPFGPEALDLFLQIELPAPPGAPRQGDRSTTISQFYDAIRRGLLDLCADMGEAAVFRGDPARQVTAALSYGGSGRIVVVDGLESALDALDEIVVQGEGADHREVWDGDHDMFHPERDEVGHHYRFQELRIGRRYHHGHTPRTGPTGEAVAVDWDGVLPMRRNPRTADHASGSPVRLAQQAFNRDYCSLLGLLEEAFDGNPGLLSVGVHAMYGLRAAAERLMAMPNEDGRGTAGPTFEYVARAERLKAGGTTMSDWEQDAVAAGFDLDELTLVADFVASGVLSVDGAPFEVLPGYWVIPGFLPYDGHVILATVDGRPTQDPRSEHDLQRILECAVASKVTTAT